MTNNGAPAEPRPDSMVLPEPSLDEQVLGRQRDRLLTKMFGVTLSCGDRSTSDREDVGATPETTPKPQVGLIAGRYELTRQAGEGGMGTVWEAFDRVLRRPVAIKLMRSEYADDANFRARFEREATALAQIRSAHIVAIHDYGIDGGHPYIVMELLVGEDLKSRIERVGQQSLTVVLDLLQQIASGLTAAAAVGIVHRDLKPGNIFLTRSDAGETVKILDFGFAWSQPETLAEGSDHKHKFEGTPAYMSPEQVRGLTPHHVSDLWAVGVIAYKALTNRLPFPQKTISELVVSICTDTFVSASSFVPDSPPELDQFFSRALAKDTARRFQTAGELVEAFATLCRGTSTIKILVADDEADMQKLVRVHFRRHIRKSQYQVIFADSGASALEQLHNHPDIDVVLADINMPVMDGLELLEKISEIKPLLETIIVTAYSNMSNIRRAMNAGAFDFVVKPINFTDLANTIAKAYRHATDRRKIASSDLEIRALRQFTNPATAARLSTTSPDLALATRTAAGAVVFIELSHPDLLTGDAAPSDIVRLINANFEVIVPEVEARGGLVDSLHRFGLMAVFTGDEHLMRATAACVAIVAQTRALARMAGAGSAYACGSRMSVGVGEVTSACIGSHVCGRLAYTSFGAGVDEAARLVREAQPNEILLTQATARLVSWPYVFVEASERSPPPSAPALGRVCRISYDNALGARAVSNTDITVPQHELEPGETIPRYEQTLTLSSTVNMTHHPYRAPPLVPVEGDNES